MSEEQHQPGTGAPVPAALARHKHQASRLAAHWKKQVGRAQLIFTQSGEGRLHLLRAREQALVEHFESRVDTRTRWGGSGLGRG